MPPRRSKRGSAAKDDDKTKTTKKSKTTELVNTIQIDEDLKKHLDKQYATSLPIFIFQFWEFCKELDPKNPLDILSLLNLNLVGPFYYINNPAQEPNKEPYIYHLKWRYYYDPPEFLTLAVSTKNNFHIGCWIDVPKDSSLSVVASNSGKNEKFCVDGDNLFSALCVEIKSRLTEPKITKIEKEKLSKLDEKLKTFAEKCGLDLSKNKVAAERSKKVVAKSFHKIGIVVPIVSEVGYRPLPYQNNELKSKLSKIVEAKDDETRMQLFAPLQEMVTYIQFANDECDYGMGLELGIDLFCNGSRYFHKMSSRLLCMAYKLLKRDLYSDIIKHHIEDRSDSNFERK